MDGKLRISSRISIFMGLADNNLRCTYLFLLCTRLTVRVAKINYSIKCLVRWFAGFGKFRLLKHDIGIVVLGGPL